jgi:hypothetical protein
MHENIEFTKCTFKHLLMQTIPGMIKKVADTILPTLSKTKGLSDNLILFFINFDVNTNSENLNIIKSKNHIGIILKLTNAM